MITAKELKQIEVKSTHESRLQTKFDKQMRKNRRRFNRTVKKAQRKGATMAILYITCPKDACWDEYESLVSKYFKDLGYNVHTQDPLIGKEYVKTTLYW